MSETHRYSACEVCEFGVVRRQLVDKGREFVNPRGPVRDLVGEEVEETQVPERADAVSCRSYKQWRY